MQICKKGVFLGVKIDPKTPCFVREFGFGKNLQKMQKSHIFRMPKKGVFTGRTLDFVKNRKKTRFSEIPKFVFLSNLSIFDIFGKKVEKCVKTPLGCAVISGRRTQRQYFVFSTREFGCAPRAPEGQKSSIL